MRNWVFVKKTAIVFLAAGMILLTGCGEVTVKQKAKVTTESYSKMSYETISVSRGTIRPKTVLEMTCDTYDRKTYHVAYDGMEVDTVYVSSGDRVKKGDLLMTFKSGDIVDQIEEYQKKIERNQMLYDHYVSLYEIDPSESNRMMRDKLKRNLEVDGMYAAELKVKLDAYSFTAEDDGIVLVMADGLENNKLSKSLGVMTIVYGDGVFQLQTKENYDFEEDIVYDAYFGVTIYPVKLVSKVENNGVKTFVFHTLDEEGSYCNKDILMIDVMQQEEENALYVPNNCVFESKGDYFVYVLDEDGFREAREVTIGATIDGVTVIRSGLTDQDKVVKN